MHNDTYPNSSLIPNALSVKQKIKRQTYESVICREYPIFYHKFKSVPSNTWMRPYHSICKRLLVLSTPMAVWLWGWWCSPLYVSGSKFQCSIQCIFYKAHFSVTAIIWHFTSTKHSILFTEKVLVTMAALSSHLQN